MIIALYKSDHQQQHGKQLVKYLLPVHEGGKRGNRGLYVLPIHQEGN